MNMSSVGLGRAEPLQADVELRTRTAPSGTYRVFVRGLHGPASPTSFPTPGVDSDTVAVELRRVEAAAEFLVLNGVQPVPGSPVAVADSFVGTVRIAVPPGAQPAIAAWVRRLAEGSPAHIVGSVSGFSVAPGDTLVARIVVRVAPAGAYKLAVHAVSFVNAAFVLANPHTVDVVVTQSDVVPPVVTVTSPADSTTVTEDDVAVVFTLTDNGGLHARSVAFEVATPGGFTPLCSTSQTGMSFVQRVTRWDDVVYVSNILSCRLTQGQHRIIIRVVDNALLERADTLTLFRSSFSVASRALEDAGIQLQLDTLWVDSTGAWHHVLRRPGSPPSVECGGDRRQH